MGAEVDGWMEELGLVQAPFMRLYFSDADPVAECGCRWRHVGDSLNDAVLAWAKHVTEKHGNDW